MSDMGDGMLKDLDSLREHEVFELVDKPNNTLIGTRWVLSEKINSDGQEESEADHLIV